MAIGAKNRRVTLQQPDGSGGYTSVETVWGSREFLAASGPETLQAGAPTAIAQWRFVIWYRSDVRAEWRVFDVDESRVFQVSSYGDLGGQVRELQLIGTEIQ